MKINRFEVVGLFGRERRIAASFVSDLNILTGRNGAGKTTVLKLLWYVISGNILTALTEIQFSKVFVSTDEYEITVTRTGKITCRVDMLIDGETFEFEDEQDFDGDVSANAEDKANEIVTETGSSVFFPTFRRIEGGFTIGASRVRSATLNSSRTRNDVEESLVALSRRLSNGAHVFVSAISTVDIVSLLLRHYTDLSEESNRLQQSVSQEIIQTIKEFKSGDESDVYAATNVIDTIRAKIESMERRREDIMTPLNAVKKLAERLFKHTGITIDPRLSFGDAASAVKSDALSAGEKQMLSFICYNAFNRDGVIFIDEPELSLHVDWQRQLFPILQQQQSSNQFIIATHSPFIYSKYPDREISIDPDRGDASAEQ